MAGIAAVLVAAWLAVALWLLPTYGPTWDCVLGEYPLAHNLLAFYGSGDQTWLDLPDEEQVPDIAAPADGPPHFELALPRRREWFQTSWLGALAAGVSCHLFYGTLGVMSSLSAHHFVAVLSAAAVIAALVMFGGRRFGLGAGVMAALLLITSPRFFAHAFNNLKDVPETALYTLTWFAGFAALTRGGTMRWATTGVLLGLAAAQKINAVFLLPQLGLLAAVVCWTRQRASPRTEEDDGEAHGGLSAKSSSASAGHADAPSSGTTGGWSWRGFALATLASMLAYVAVSPMYWSDPAEAWSGYVGFMSMVGSTFTSEQSAVATALPGGSAIDTHGALHVLWTTPLSVLALALVGLCASRIGERPLGIELRALLVLGIAVPIGRTLLPGMRNFDGVRHFLEFTPTLCLAAGVGAMVVAHWIKGRAPVPSASGAQTEASSSAAPSPAPGPTPGPAPGPARGVTLTAVIVGIAALVPGLLATTRTHPNGIAYYNVLAGGLTGAQQRGLREATDYWGNSYWQGLAWLDENATENAALLVPVAPHIVACAEPVRLRDDIHLLHDKNGPPRADLYVMFVTRRDWYPTALRDFLPGRRATHRIVLDGATLLEIHHVPAGPAAGDAFQRWRDEVVARRVTPRFQTWLRQHPKQAPRVAGILRRYTPERLDQTVAELRTNLPANLHAALPALVLFMQRESSPD